MIKIFSRIRRALFSENKFRQYILYAIGEIILVVIGILIALSINNRNEMKKNDIEVDKYLTNLKVALNEDFSSMEQNLSFNKTRLKGIFYILDHAALNSQTFTEFEWVDISENDQVNPIWRGPFPDSLDQKFTEVAFSILGRGFGGASFNKSVISELYSTGYFSNIKDANLKIKIAEYYSFLEQRLEGYAIEEHEEWANETTRFFRDRYGIFTLDISGLEDSISIIKGKKDVEHQLRYLALEVNYHCVWLFMAKSKALNIVSLIDENIQNK